MSRINHLAVIVAAVLFFLIGAGWYTAFQAPWLAGIGKTLAQLTAESGGSPMPYLVGFVAILVMCYTLAWVMARSGVNLSASQGALSGLTVALGIVGAAIALNYGFESRSVTLWLINAGYVAVGLTLAGAIIGGWKRKR